MKMIVASLTGCTLMLGGAVLAYSSSFAEENSSVPVEKVESMFRKINDKVSVSPQISLEDIATAKAEGVSLIVNNRPDGEEPTAPQSAEIEAAAKAAGIDYIAIPITHSGFSAPQVDAMISALDGTEGKTLAYCRSGTRSTLLWSLAQAKQGVSPDEIARLAGNAGYDITPIRAMVDALAGSTN
ncbi:hypothetical protein GCM10009096_13760 [Parasphingorhabdus litoris]|uniref:Beta-lactamase hydrolase-like protein phosphatase-like domain-containing protein n=1 Tax=Parasphingorhabdus litoris TaxID=394733 RepID=A0ABN1ADC3_9SPHN|nr:TIGR01244 family sulfur transferase [Parasphingorhabdus litoris]